MMKSSINRNVVRKIKLNEEKSDYSYWKNKSYEERIEALEQIRSEYNNWRYKKC